jgi:hypothetical protein
MALVSFAGLMSGLTLGLMSLTVVDLEVLIKAGQPQERKNAGSYQYFLTMLYFLSLLKHLTEFFNHMLFIDHGREDSAYCEKSAFTAMYSPHRKCFGYGGICIALKYNKSCKISIRCD